MSKIRKSKEEFIVRLSRVVTDYHTGISRINRECDEASEKIDKTISSILTQNEKHEGHLENELSQDSELRKQAEDIELSIERLDGEISRLDQGIAAVDKAIHSLSRAKAGLEQQIQNRCLIEMIFYSFFHDAEKEKCDLLRKNLDDRANERAVIEETKQKFESSRLKAVSRKNSFLSALGEINQKRATLRKIAENYNERARCLVGKRMEVENLRKKRKDNLMSIASLSWVKASQEITQAVSPLLQQQPAFSDFRNRNILNAKQIPEVLLLGSQTASFKNLDCLVPHTIFFPFEHSLTLPENNTAQRRLTHHLLLRLMQIIPPGRLEVTLVDPVKLGQSFAPFLPLLKVEQLMPQGRVLTRSEEIEAMLCNLTDEVEDLIQHRFKGRITNWLEYNKANAENQLCYKLLLVFDAPEQLSDKSLWYLERLVESGTRCGILPIIAIDDQRLEERKYERFRATLNSSTRRLDTLVRISDKTEGGLLLSYRPDYWPSQEVLDSFLSVLAEHYAESSRFNKELPDLWKGYSAGADTIGGFDVPIGWTLSGEPVFFTLGSIGSEHHALLAGKTGTGKSNLLHVMIHSLCEKYSPSELDLYLLDYKESTEFTVYAKPPLPQARLVATESDPEYGLTVLQHLVDELEARAKLFKSKGVHDFSEYRTELNSELSRILLVIDEFQVLFMEGRQLAEVAEKLLSQLLKQGRSFGIHILLATQTLKGINALSLGSLVSQLGCRIALACGQEDSAMILSGNNFEAAGLKSPPEGIINNANGAKSGNVKFLIPLAERGFCRNHLSTLAECAINRGFRSKTRVFNGALLPSRPVVRELQRISEESAGLCLGEQLTFTSNPLLVPLIRRQAFNVLFSGYDDLIHDGLLVSTIASLTSAGGFDEIVYFNGRGIEPGGDFADVKSACGDRFIAYTEIGLLPLQEIADSIGKHRTALIIDGLDAEKALHPVQTYRTPRPDDKPTPADLLKLIAEEGSRRGTFVFSFIDNWRRCAVSCKDLFNFFELRVAFCMNEDDAGALVSGSIVGKFRGIEKPNRAVYVNRMTNEITWFRPYIDQKGIEV